jgi:LPXTG-site transpeptidase (sortase) family protein
MNPRSLRESSEVIRQLVKSGAVAVGLLAATLSVSIGAIIAPASAAVGGSSRYNPVAPERLIDTRSSTRPGAGAVVHVPVVGRFGVSGSAVAVVVNVTATDAANGGYVTVYPGSSERPNVSSLNLPGPGATLANLVTVPIGSDGGINVFTETGTHVIVDLFGWYEPTGWTDKGRFQPLEPFRAYDSRRGQAVGRGGTIRVGLKGVPSSASAAVLNITAVGSPDAGFWTAFAAGTDRPSTSNLNTSAGATVPNQVIVPLTNGSVDLYSDVGGHVLVDVVGFFTGAGTDFSAVGLFTPIVPTRFLDTRRTDNPLGARVKPYAGWTVEVPVAGRAGIPNGGVSAIVTNTTMGGARTAGYVTAYPAGISRPTVSNLNLGYAGQTVANHAVTPISNRGAGFFTDGGGHLIVDVAGYYSGSPALAYQAAATNPEPTVSLPARLEIPKISIDDTVREGIDLGTVNNGPGHWPGTAGPSGLGNFTVFGHRVSYSHPFRDLDRLSPGDSIYITAEDVTYRYEIMRSDIVSPENIEVLSPYEPGQRTLTLIACHPPTSIEFRIVVKARFAEITAS